MFRFTCHPDGGEPFEVIALSRAIAAWENAPGQRGPKRNVGDLTQSLKMADMVDLAWFAADRAGKTGLDLYGDEDDDEAGPTRETP